MKNMITLSLCAACALGLSTSTIRANEQNQAAPPAQRPADLQFSKLRDAKITSSDGEQLGQLDNLIVNPRTGQIKFAVVGRGGILGIGEKLIPVPWKLARLQSESEFSLNVDKAKLEGAPKVNKDLSEFNSPAFEVSVNRYYQMPAGVGGAEIEGGQQSQQQESSGWK